MTELHTFALSDMRAAMKAVEDGGHSVFSPSGSKMWLTCSGSLIPNLFAPDDAGIEAAYGTVAHGIGEEWLKTGVRPSHRVGSQEIVYSGDWGFLIDIDDVMLDYVQQYVDYCEWLPGEHFVETKVYFSELTPIPKQGGTADHVACWPGNMIITDLKMGKGVHVYAKGNTQALLYALGFFYAWDHKYHFEKFVIRIAQPRRDNFDEWTVDRAYLLKFAKYVQKRAARAWVQNAPRNPSGEACQWCKIKKTCTALAKSMVDMTEGTFDDLATEVTRSDMASFKESLGAKTALNTPDVTQLDTSDLERILKFRPAAEKFFAAAGDELFRRANDGEKVVLWKIVDGRSHRAYRNPKAAGEHLVKLGLKRSDVFSTDVISPAQAEEALRKIGIKGKALEAEMGSLVFKPPGKPTLAPVEDRRTARQDVSGDAFEDLIVKS